VHIVEAQLNVLLPDDLAVQLEQGVVMAESLAARAIPKLIGEAHVDDLAGLCGGELARNARVEDDVYVGGVLLPGVDVVRHGEHQVGGDEEGCSSAELFAAVAGCEVADAVVREGLDAVRTQFFGDIAEVVLVIVLLVVNIHLKIVEN
jgi:hypothetical protein